jgi:prepilin-type N-terminal cleavage/methylation domain-containing protein
MNLRRAFTLIELLVVIAIIGILAALLMPALSQAKQRAQGIICLNGGKQIMTAITLYVGDNNDFYPPNPDDGNTDAGYNWCSGQAGDQYPNDHDQFNPDVLKDPKLCLVSQYLSGNTSLFHCPGDKRYGLYTGANPALQGQFIPAARTFSMNQAVGTIDPGFDAGGPGPPGINSHSGAPTLSVNGPWLNGQDDHRRNSPWFTYGKSTSMNNPGPSMTWVLLDEDARGLNDAAFAFDMQDAEWVDMPGTYHNSGCGFAFADAHSEAHKWRMSGLKQGGVPITDAGDKQDWLWLRARTSADSTGTMPTP